MRMHVRARMGCAGARYRATRHGFSRRGTRRSEALRDAVAVALLRVRSAKMPAALLRAVRLPRAPRRDNRDVASKDRLRGNGRPSPAPRAANPGTAKHLARCDRIGG